MMQTLIDPLRFADRFKEAGFTAAQAEAPARTPGDESTEQPLSKADFNALDAGLDRRMDALPVPNGSSPAPVGVMLAPGTVGPVSTPFGS